jgi:hypothetical protein
MLAYRILAIMRARELERRQAKEVMEEGVEFPPTECRCGWWEYDNERKWVRVTTHLKCSIHNRENRENRS